MAKAAGRLGPGDRGLAPVLLAWRRGRPQGCLGPGGQEHAGHGKAKTQAIEHQHAPQAGNPHKPGPQKRRRNQHQSIAAGKQAIGPVARHPRRYQQGDQAGKTKHQAGLGRGRQALQGQQGQQARGPTAPVRRQQQRRQRQGAQGPQAIGHHHHAPPPPVLQVGADHREGQDFGHLNNDGHGGEIQQLVLHLEEP